MYSAPPACGSRIAHPFAGVCDDGLPGGTSTNPSLCSTRNIPFSTTVNSSNSESGRAPHPPGTTHVGYAGGRVFELTRPMYSSISLGLFPAAWMRVGWAMSVGMKFVVLSASIAVEGS